MKDFNIDIIIIFKSPINTKSTKRRVKNNFMSKQSLLAADEPWSTYHAMYLCRHDGWMDVYINKINGQTGK